MALILDSWLATTATILAGLFAACYLYAAYQYTYWTRKGIPNLTPSFPFGNVAGILMVRKSIGQTYRDFYEQLAPHPYGGIVQFLRQTLVLRDPEVIKSFLVKDFDHFHDRGLVMDEKNDPLSARLFLLPGQRWKLLRNSLTPTFTSGKIKLMFEKIAECADQMEECVREDAKRGTVEIKDILARFTTDSISSCAFGIQCNCLKNPDAEFRQKGREIMNPNFWFSLAIALGFIAPGLSKWLGFGVIPKHLEDFFTQTVNETIEYREGNNVKRNDFMQMMIELKNNSAVDLVNRVASASKGHVLPHQIVAQTLGFYLAGFETSSSTMSYCLFELSIHEDIQKRVREEMDTVIKKHGGQVTYEAVMEMEYLDRVVAETLRKYPSVPILNRECTKPYKLPETDVVIEVGTAVVVPVWAIHHDPQFYPDPEHFDPERFTSEGKLARHSSTYLPFGMGPRNCLGLRFGLVQTKLGLITLLRNFYFKRSPKMPLVLEYDQKNFFLVPVSGIFVDITERTK